MGSGVDFIRQDHLRGVKAGPSIRRDSSASSSHHTYTNFFNSIYVPT